MEKKIEMLVGMGFGPNAAIEALKLNNFSVNQAIDFILAKKFDENVATVPAVTTPVRPKKRNDLSSGKRTAPTIGAQRIEKPDEKPSNKSQLPKMIWMNVKTKGKKPENRYYHCACAIHKQMYIFGGDGDSGYYPMDVIYILDTWSPTPEWRCVKATGDIPRPRKGQSTCVVGNKIFVFGGYGGERFNDLYILNVKQNPDELHWTRGETTGPTPYPRSYHTSVSLGRNILFFGGFKENSHFFGEVHILNTQTMVWTKSSVNGTIPAPRHSHTANSVNSCMYIFGGDGDTNDLESANEVYHLSTEHLRWKKMTVTGQAPRRRDNHTACVVNDKIIIFGGHGGNVYLNDVYMLDIAHKEWRACETIEETPGCRPSPCGYHTTVAIKNKLWVFGGFDSGNNRYHNDVYMLNTREAFNWLSWNMRTLLNEEDFSDHVLTVSGREFNVHKAIIQARCPSLLCGNNVPDITTQQAFTKFLEFIYCHQFPDEFRDLRDLMSLLCLSSDFKIACLTRHCYSYLATSLTSTNICKAIGVAADFDRQPLLDFLLTWVSSNKNSLLEKFSPLKEEHKDNSKLLDRLLQVELSDPCSYRIELDLCKCKTPLLGSHLPKLLTNGEMSDFVLEIEGRELKVHKALLSCRSEFFAGVLRSGMSESKLGMMKLPGLDEHGISYSALQALVYYFYSGEFSHIVDVEVCLQILANAGYYGLSDDFSYIHIMLIDHLEEQVILNLTKDNCIDIYQRADAYQLTGMRKRLLNFIADNYEVSINITISSKRTIP